MNPRFPVYVPSKGRADSRLTVKALEAMRVPFRVIVEHQEFDQYAAVIDPKKLLVLDPAFQRDYQTCDDLGDSKPKGAGPARNFAWAHSMSEGHAWHWQMDDNIRSFCRANYDPERRANRKVQVTDGTILRCMEDFALRYENCPQVGPNYWMFIPKRVAHPPIVFNTRIYSCYLIRNDLPFRFRARYNEDTDFSLRILKRGMCTAQFNSFLQYKMPTQTVPGGLMRDFYSKEGTGPKSEILYRLHPDVTRLVTRFHREHHFVNYRPFKNNRLVLREGVTVPQGADEYGMVVSSREPARQVARRTESRRRP